jgi:hypothetical protein
MADYTGTRVAPRQLVGGFAQAVERFAAATRTTDADPAYFALFEALNWAVAVDDYVREIWVPHGEPLGRGWTDLAGTEADVELLDATRYARNLVHHHSADALVNVEGERFPETFPSVFHSWVWRDAGDLPVHPRPDAVHNARNRAAYATHFAGVRAEDTLHALREPFERVRMFLDPPRATPPGP